MAKAGVEKLRRRSFWERAFEAGKLTPQLAKRAVSPEQQELSKLRAELSRVKMENAILKNRPRVRWRTPYG